ncbi:MAG: DNA internalization-related competence protein ComEC/Rec2 [Desulfobulbales bacterium]
MQYLSGRPAYQSPYISPELLIIFVFYAGGICLAEQFALSFQLVWLCLLFFLCLLFSIYKLKLQLNTKIFRSLLGFIFFLLGILQYSQSQPTSVLFPDHIYNLIKHKQTATIEGILIGYPSVINSSSNSETRLLVRAEALYKAATDQNQKKQNSSRASGLILLTLNGLLPENIVPGDHILIKASLSRIHTYSTPGAFNYKEYLANQSIFIKGWVQSSQNIIKIHQVNSDVSASLFTTINYLPERIRRNIAVFLENNLRQPPRGLYKAILIDDRNDVPSQILNYFTEAGCLHILAISGMHLGLLALITIAFITWLLKRSTWIILHLPTRKIAVFVALLPLSFYALIAGSNIPILRALLMTCVFILAIFFDRPGNLINHILAAAFLILIWKPRLIFSASFQLSFSAVTAIALIYPIVYRFLYLGNQLVYSGMINSAETAALMQGKLIRNKVFIIILTWVSSGLALTTAAMLGTLPLLLFHFNRISLIAPLSNLLVEPLICFWSLLIGLVASLFIPVLPALAKILYTAGGSGLTAAAKICAFGSALPNSSLWLPTPSIFEIAVYYFLLLTMLRASHREGRSKCYSLILALLLACLLVVSPAVIQIQKTFSGGPSVTFLDVGHGSSIILQLPGSRNILIDGGGSQNDRFNIGERVIGPFLWKRKLDHLDAVVITHAHADHFNGLPFILSHFHPDELWINSGSIFDDEYGDLLDLAGHLGIEIKIAKADDILYQYGKICLLCLHSGFGNTDYWSFKTDSDKPLNQNDLSIVLRLDTDSGDFLFPADISAAMAETLIREGKRLKAKVLMAPHHGNSSSLSQEFIRRVAPEYIVISAGHSNSFNFPAESYFEMQQQGKKILSTSKQGTITFEVGKPGSGKLNVENYQIN